MNSGSRPSIILASRSPRRLELARSAGWIVTVAAPNEAVEESQPPRAPEEPLAAYVQRLARAKAEAVAAAVAAGTLVACDTLSDVDGTVLLHPAPGLPAGIDQPLPPPAAWLPGTANDVGRVWATPADAATFVVVAAAGPVPELEALLPKLRRAGSAATADAAPPAAPPADGAAVVAGAPGAPLPSPLLQRAADLARTATMSNGPLTPDTVLAGVWVGSWRVKPKAAPPPAGR